MLAGCRACSGFHRKFTKLTVSPHALHPSPLPRPMASEATAPSSANKDGLASMVTEAKLLEALTSVPILTKAWCRPGASGSVNMLAVYSQHNLPANAKRQLAYSVHLSPTEGSKLTAMVPGLPLELREHTLLSISPSGRKMLAARMNGDGCCVLELWVGKRLAKEVVVSKTLHGNVYNDGYFSRGAAWNQEETAVVYVADVPLGDRTPLWCGEEKTEAGPKGWRGQGPYQDDWGETYAGRSDPSLYVLDVEKFSVTQVRGLPEDHSCGQPVWCPSGKGLVFVAWPHTVSNLPHTERKLGIIYCYNRPAALHYVSFSTALKDTEDSSPLPVSHPLVPSLMSATSPCFTPKGDALLFISYEAAARTGVHSATAALYKMGWPLEGFAEEDLLHLPEVQQLVPEVDRPACTPEGLSDPTSFPGLYCGALGDQPFLGDDFLLLTSQYYSQTAILGVHLPSGSVRPLTHVGSSPLASWSFLGVSGKVIAASCSAPGQPPRLMVTQQVDDSDTGPVLGPWEEVEELQADLSPVPEVTAAFGNIRTELLDITPTCGDASIPFQAIVQMPRSGPGPFPTVLFPHGGPHSAIACNYYLPFAFLVAQGYCVVAVNFRGSLGFGEASVQSLPGHVGHYDVEDCMAALHAAIEKGYSDPLRVAVCGGSHGGFLTGHLVGQYPNVFKCASLRNPVLNIALMVHVTDIPDWCYVEAYGCKEGQARFSATPTPEDLEQFFKMSPAAHLANVKAPLMFQLGAKDRRVPMDDGKRYGTALKSRGVPTRTLVFPEDTHALDKPQAEYEGWMNTAWWLKEYL